MTDEKSLTKVEIGKVVTKQKKEKFNVLLPKEEVNKLAKVLKTSVNQTKRLLTDEVFFSEWLKNAERQRIALFYSFIAECLPKLKEQIHQLSPMTMSKTVGILSDKIDNSKKSEGGMSIQVGDRVVNISYPNWNRPYGDEKK